jgi:hypothetical protein
MKPPDELGQDLHGSGERIPAPHMYKLVGQERPELLRRTAANNIYGQQDPRSEYPANSRSDPLAGQPDPDPLPNAQLAAKLAGQGDELPVIRQRPPSQPVE